MPTLFLALTKLSFLKLISGGSTNAPPSLPTTGGSSVAVSASCPALLASVIVGSLTSVVVPVPSPLLLGLGEVSLPNISSNILRSSGVSSLPVSDL